MTAVNNPKKFWIREILPWEQSRYRHDHVSEFSVIERRAHEACTVIRPHIVGKTLVDLGCGSGYFLKLFEDDHPKKLIGVDFATTAIAHSVQLHASSTFSFFEGDVTTDSLPNADIYTGLGLLDWLTLEGIEILFSKLNDKQFLFSFSERRISLNRYAHKIFSLVRYGLKSNFQYLPQYHTQAQLLERLTSQNISIVRTLRPRSLGFCTFITNIKE